ncbi:hypothetical protein RZS08_25365, partial [Arthrospira platensis SPKY1]|nr:hypothetical protein [Arthrospira platensis SPKY1]
LQDIDNILKLENELLNLINLLDKEKDKVNIILKGYSESDLKENNRINLIKKITSTTIKGKIKEDQMYDKQIYSLLKDIEILKKDINKLDNDCMQIIKEINQESTNKINKLDFIISSLNSDIKKIKDIYIEKK